MASGLAVEWLATIDDLATFDGQDVVDQAQEGGLAGAVGAEQAVDAPLAQGEGNVVEGAARAEVLGEMVGFEYVHLFQVLRFMTGHR